MLYYIIDYCRDVFLQCARDGDFYVAREKGFFGKDLKMRRDREDREAARVTRRNGTRMGGEFDSAGNGARERSYREEYSYRDDRNDRRYREERDDRRYRD